MEREKVDRDMYVKVQPSLYAEFQKTCNSQLKTISAVVRDLMMDYVKKHNVEKK